MLVVFTILGAAALYSMFRFGFEFAKEKSIEDTHLKRKFRRRAVLLFYGVGIASITPSLILGLYAKEIGVSDYGSRGIASFAQFFLLIVFFSIARRNLRTFRSRQ